MPLPTREGDSEDFIFKLLYTMTHAEVREAYINMILNMKAYVEQISDATVKQAYEIHNRDAMQLVMLQVLTMDDTNGLVCFVRQHAKPRSRMEYFRVWFHNFAQSFMRVRLQDTNIPDPRAIMSVVRGEYMRRRDNGAEWRTFYHEYKARPRPKRKINTTEETEEVTTTVTPPPPSKRRRLTTG